jgi:glutaredoxin
MKVLIYGTPQCSLCTKAKDLCEALHFNYDYKTVGFDVTIEQLEERVGKKVKSVPQIFIMVDGLAEYIGGFSELQRRLS